MRKRIAKQTMGILLAAGLFAGCTQQETAGNQAGDRADRMLERTITSVLKERPAYKSSTELIVAGIAVPRPVTQAEQGGTASPDLVWNPYETLEFIQNADKTVTLEKDADNPQLQVLKITVDPSQWTAHVKEGWQKRIAGLQAEGSALIQKRAAKLSGEKGTQLEKELSTSLEKARANMARMVETLRADGTYRILINPGVSRPQTITIENRQQYESDGKVREETLRSTFDFRQNTAE
jgi:hypothetical protein